MKKVRKKGPPDSKGWCLHWLCAVLPEKLSLHGFGQWLDSSHLVIHWVLCKLGLLSVTYNNIPDFQQSRAKVSVKISWPFPPCPKMVFATLDIKSTFQDKRRGRKEQCQQISAYIPLTRTMHAICSFLAAREPEKDLFFSFSSLCCRDGEGEKEWD